MLSRTFLDAHARGALAAVADTEMRISGVSEPVMVAFQAAFASPLDVASVGPAARACSEDVEDVAQGTTVTIDGTRYQVVGNEPDGTGLTVLRLMKV